MEIPIIARMSDFDAHIASLTAANPSLISRRFWKWGALLLALVYAFTSVARKIRILFLQRYGRDSKLCSSTPESVLSCVNDDDGDDVVLREGENDDVCSSYSSEDENVTGFYEDFRVAGRGQKRKFEIRRQRSLAGDGFASLAELVNGEGVVKLWDGLGLEVEFGGSNSIGSGGSISILNLDKNVTIGSIMGRIPAVSASPRMVFTARGGVDGRLGVSSWDMRMRRRTPAVKAEWRQQRSAAVVGVKAGGIEKVYLRDDVSGNVTVGDMRMAKSPLTGVTEEWCESNGVSDTDEE